MQNVKENVFLLGPNFGNGGVQIELGT